MIQYTYDHELITMTNMFLNSMSTIIVKRFNVHKQARDQIKTRVLYAPKQRVLHDLLNRDQNLRLPVVAVTISGITRDQNRVFNKILGTYHSVSDSTKSGHEGAPLPIDITYNVSIMTRYQQDMDQIISHIIPYINPYFTVSWRTPQRPDYEIRSNVFWDGNVKLEYPVDLNASQVARVLADLTFTFKGWMFQAPKEPVTTISSVELGFTNIGTTIMSEFSLEEKDLYESDAKIVYNAIPPRIEVIEPTYGRVAKQLQIDMWGKGFEKVFNVYLSGDCLSGLQLFSPYATISSLSSLYPTFEGVKIDESKWHYNKENYISIEGLSAYQPGEIDIVIEGPKGYGKLTDTLNAIKIR